VSSFNKDAADVARVYREVAVQVTAHGDDVIREILLITSRDHPAVDDVTAQGDDGVGSRRRWRTDKRH